MMDADTFVQSAIAGMTSGLALSVSCVALYGRKLVKVYARKAIADARREGYLEATQHASASANHHLLARQAIQAKAEVCFVTLRDRTLPDSCRVAAACSAARILSKHWREERPHPPIHPEEAL